MTRSVVLLQDAVVDEGPQDEGVHGGDDGVEDHDGDEDGQDLAVGDGEGEHAPCRALLDPVLEDGPVLAHGAHAGPSAAAPAAHAVSPHTHACNLPSEVPDLVRDSSRERRPALSRRRCPGPSSWGSRT